MLTRSIDFTDPSQLTIEEKIFYGAKRVCVVFAVAALMISGLDLLNIRPREAVAGFAQARRDLRMAQWPALIRSGINEIELKTPPIMATAEISNASYATGQCTSHPSCRCASRGCRPGRHGVVAAAA